MCLNIYPIAISKVIRDYKMLKERFLQANIAN